VDDREKIISANPQMRMSSPDFSDLPGPCIPPSLEHQGTGRPGKSPAPDAHKKISFVAEAK
jgi:hypothetical protein